MLYCSFNVKIKQYRLLNEFGSKTSKKKKLSISETLLCRYVICLRVATVSQTEYLLQTYMSTHTIINTLPTHQL